MILNKMRKSLRACKRELRGPPVGRGPPVEKHCSKINIQTANEFRANLPILRINLFYCIGS